MTSLTIAFDFDAVLCNSMVGWIKLFHEAHPDRRVPKVRHITSWALDPEFDASYEEIKALFEDSYNQKMIKYCAPMDSNFVIWLEAIQRMGHECFVLTKNPPKVLDVIRYWLESYGIYMPIVNVGTIEEKMNVDWDILVDDSEHAYNMHDWDDPATHRTLYLYSTPANDHCVGKNKVERVYNWENIFSLVTTRTLQDDLIDYITGDF